MKCINLALASERRAFRGRGPAQGVIAEVAEALDDVAMFAETAAATLRLRLAPPEDEQRKLVRMAKCCDLRKMAFDSGNYVPPAELALKALLIWMRRRNVGAGGSDDDPTLVDDMPEFDVVWEQFKLLTSRLVDAAKERAFTHWVRAKGTVIMKDVFTLARFYTDCHDYLYFYSHMATKTMCEAVVEGMGSTWDECATDGRHLSLEHGMQEAVLAWSAPQPWHPEAKAFITHSLNHLFGGRAWNFHHDQDRTDRVTPWRGGSRVIKGKKDEPMRLPSRMYDVPAL